ncbi:MAG: T9SS type A sorting domain-containing protein, partial [Ignavibacteria bacterium]|nr:T9SS type A sorting domain-containing protein [Ignavibacteria bacterium]
LNWTTATEINNYGFEILRSDCKNAWQKIGFVNGFGNCNSEKNYSFIDQPLGGKEFKYKLRQIDFDGTYDFSSEIIVMLDEINKFQLEQNYPNPFNPFTTISYQLPVSGQVTLTVYDLLGRKVEELVNDFQESGFYAINFNGINLPSGTYFYKLECGTFSETKKFILMK